MRVSVPNIPQSLLSFNQKANKVTVSEAIERTSAFLAPGNVTLITGAGVSVDSGIRAYRGQDGRYMNPNYKPIFYHELVDETEKGHSFRQRYWLRSYLGYPSVREALPNTTHYALAALQYAGVIPRLITQNVDGLHHAALSLSHPSPVKIQESILELHGTLHRVRCKHGHITERNVFQDWLASANPKWKDFADSIEKEGAPLRTNPDGDVAIEHLGISYDDFVVPECPTCLQENRHNNVHKPDLVFFGESITEYVKKRSYLDIENSDRVLLIGTTLATYSAFRLLKHAIELKKPVLMINVGPSRADGVEGVQKLDIASGDIISDVVRNVLVQRGGIDSVVERMLSSGIRKPPPKEDDGDRALAS
ncbi:DHS-like NAD/FAD-binding domain-containing protein [Lentinula raphanica]|uniref:DHS-like NAD/FAD-binding domain-containing protein n=1 Tax=Lentinula raphanica TaxID=153919 RepID=A0AA38PK90_9AGAR|nr:DHS-like NAD/FAD-binding domain-containing protein [Lentinula raphanica]KAJ3844444.1 DHS-like NAD/FAD-binding domain-containing protein [Lentinula raphanica]